MSMGIEPTDSELAKDVRDAVKAFNDALRRAHDAGLIVRVDYDEHRTVSKAHALRIYRSEIWRPI